MNLEVQLSNGETKLMRTLIDTGAEANLIRTGFVPHHITFAARKVLNLIAANGQKIKGVHIPQKSQCILSKKYLVTKQGRP